MKKAFIFVFCIYPFAAFGGADDLVIGGDISAGGGVSATGSISGAAISGSSVTSSGDIIADKAGSNQNSPNLSLLGDNSGNEIEGKLFLAYGADPYLVFSVDDDGTTPLITDVLHLDNSSIRPASAALLNLGSTGNYFNIAYLVSLYANDDLIIGSDDGFQFSSTTEGIGGTADTGVFRGGGAGIVDIGKADLSGNEIRLDATGKKIYLDSSDTDTYIYGSSANTMQFAVGGDNAYLQVRNSKLDFASLESVYGEKGFVFNYLDTGVSYGSYLFGIVPYDANRGLNGSSGAQYGIYANVMSEQTGTATYNLIYGSFDNTSHHASAGTDNYLLNLSLTSGPSFKVDDEGDIEQKGVGGNTVTQTSPDCETLTFAADPGDASKTCTGNGVIPDGAILISVTSKVTSASASNCSSIIIGTAGDTDAFAATGSSIAQNSTTDNSDATAAFTSYMPALSDTAIVVTAEGDPCFDLVIDICPTYFIGTAP